LRELAAAHRRRLPDDPLSWYCEGVALQADGEYEKAERAYAEGQTKPPPPGMPSEVVWWLSAESFRRQRIDCLYKAGKWRTAYETVGPTDRTFEYLATFFERDRDAGGLGELVAAHKAKLPATELSVWEAYVRFMRGEYRAVIAEIEALRKAGGRTLPQRRRAHDALVRSYLRVGDAAAARRTYTETYWGSPLHNSLYAAVLAAAGDAEELDWAIAGGLGRTYDLSSLYADEDFAREFAAERFADLRKKYPDPRANPGR
jgi:tetratricopeptide (TPR) repeat protein